MQGRYRVESPSLALLMLQSAWPVYQLKRVFVRRRQIWAIFET